MVIKRSRCETLIEEIENVEEQLGLIETFLRTLPEKAMHLGIRVVLAIVFFIIGVKLIKLVRNILKKSLTKANADMGVIQFLDSLTKAILYMILIFMLATSFGLDAASVLAVIGSAGLTIGLALQGSLSNFVGGVLILLIKPFRVGDYIIEDNYKNEGTVSEIQLFYTKLTTADNKTVVLPNGALANTSLTNVTETYKRRINLIIGISYDADLKKAKDIVADILEKDNEVIKTMEKLVFVNELADSAVEIGVRCYVINEEYWNTRWRLLEEIKLAFDENGIGIPYPQMDVHMAARQE